MVYAELADPTRRRILELVADQERSSGWIADQFNLSGPAISKHLRVLRQAQLVSCEQRGTRRMYRLAPAPLLEVRDWINETTAFWEGRLDALEQHLAES